MDYAPPDPPGGVPDIVSYISPASMIAIATVPTGLSIIAVSLRFYIRRGQASGLSWDDWLLVPGLVLTIGMAISVLVGVGLGSVGYDSGLPPAHSPVEYEQQSNDRTLITQRIRPAVQIMQAVALGFIKSSFVMFYRRVFGRNGRDWFWWASAVCLGLVVAWTLTFFLANIFYCGIHFSAQEGSYMDQAVYCSHDLEIQFSNALTDFVIDVFIILLPIPAIIQLNLSATRKLLVFGVFVLGALAVASSAARLGIISIIFRVGLVLSVDRDKGAAAIIFWSMLENGAAIVAACLPVLRVLLRNGRSSRLAEISPAYQPTAVATQLASVKTFEQGRSRGRHDSAANDLEEERGRGRGRRRQIGDTDISHLDLNEGGTVEKAHVQCQEHHQVNLHEIG